MLREIIYHQFILQTAGVVHRYICRISLEEQEDAWFFRDRAQVRTAMQSGRAGASFCFTQLAESWKVRAGQAGGGVSGREGKKRLRRACHPDLRRLQVSLLVRTRKMTSILP